MSGPYCETCKFFRSLPLGGGECTDPSKIIYASGMPLNGAPGTAPLFECSNHSVRLAQEDKDDDK